MSDAYMAPNLKRSYGDCPYCGKKIWFYNEKDVKYGSPIRTCKDCKREYHDPRYYEMAWHGLDPNLLLAKNRLIMMVVLLALGGACLGLNFADIYFRGRYYLSLFIIPVFCLPGALWMLWDALYILSGRKKAHYDKLMLESKDRLGDVVYVTRLVELGYLPPDRK